MNVVWWLFGTTKLPTAKEKNYSKSDPSSMSTRPLCFKVAAYAMVWLLLLFLCSSAQAAAATARSTRTRNIHGTAAVTRRTTPKLPWGDINVLVLTDVHSWVGGHARQEGDLYDADYGDVLSFYEYLKAYALEDDQDFFFVSNGDWVHGTGLGAPGFSDGSSSNSGNLEDDTKDPIISSLVPLLEKMPWDAVNCGNHELYETSMVEYMTRPGGFVSWWGDRYLTANVMVDTSKNNQKDLNEQQQQQQQEAPEENTHPLGHRYKILQGKHSRLLVFGFLYNLDNPSEMIRVTKVEEVVQNQSWFRKVLLDEEYDAILVLAHMDLVDPLVFVIRDGIRNITGNPNMPIQFITGHTHYRGTTMLDGDTTSYSFEAGRYLDTVGFVSFPTVHTVNTIMESKNDNASETAQYTDTLSSTFQNVFLNAHRHVLADTIGLEEWRPTKNGQDLSEFIISTQSQMGLLEEVGCAPQDYFFTVTVDNPQSLWGLYRDEVAPKAFFHPNGYGDHSRSTSNKKNSTSAVMFLSTESWRYDLLSSSTLVVDDIYAVSPFNDTVMYMGNFSGETIILLNSTMNHPDNSHDDLGVVSSGILPSYLLISEGDIVDSEHHMYHLYTHHYESSWVKDALEKIAPNHSTVAPKSTPYASAQMWLSFVREFWACTGNEKYKRKIGTAAAMFSKKSTTPISCADFLGKVLLYELPYTISVTILLAFFTAFVFLGGFGLWLRNYFCNAQRQHQPVVVQDGTIEVLQKSDNARPGPIRLW